MTHTEGGKYRWSAFCAMHIPHACEPVRSVAAQLGVKNSCASSVLITWIQNPRPDFVSVFIISPPYIPVTTAALTSSASQCHKCVYFIMMYVENHPARRAEDTQHYIVYIIIHKSGFRQDSRSFWWRDLREPYRPERWRTLSLLCACAQALTSMTVDWVWDFFMVPAVGTRTMWLICLYQVLFG